MAHAILALHRDLNDFDSASRPCAMCGLKGHNFEGCDELKGPVVIRNHYIKLRLAMNRLRNVAKQTNVKDLNFLRPYTINALESLVCQQVNRLSMFQPTGGSQVLYSGGMQPVNGLYGASM